MPVPKILLTGVLGGLTIFVWGAISHMVLPFYNSSLHRFADEGAMTQAILANAPSSGVYFMPYEPALPEDATSEERQASSDAMMKRMADGPFVLASIRIGPMGSLPLYFVVQLIADILTGLLLTLLIWQARHLSLKGRVTFSVGVALTIICASNLPYWNWYAFSTSFTLAEAFDQIVGLGLAGIVAGKLIPSPGA